MTERKVLKTIFILCFILISAGLWAMGRADDSEPQPVTGLENWNHSMDISEMPPGEYNIIIRGTDRAGNTGTGGPYNIFIDPSINIPSVSISTPSEGSRVENLVNVVGTAVDDKEITRVEIAVDDGNFTPVDGTEFWSVTLDSSAWEDGPHTIRVRARDGEKNESPPAEVSFIKDTVPPLIDVVSHESGSYISGRVELQGTIVDLNGIQDAWFISDSNDEPGKLQLSRGKEEGLWNFKLNINTRDYEDGAHVYRIEAADGLGLSSTQSFLYYIDNSPPELYLLYPESEEAVNGNISLVGLAEDAVGLTSLSFEADNGASGEIALSPGNPVWNLPLDYNSFSGKEARIKMVLTDLVGNIASETFRVPLDHTADLPSPGLSGSETAEVYYDVPVITGMLKDDDGSAGSIEYSLNRNEKQILDVDGPWQLRLDGARPGANTLEIWAIDRNGLKGEPVTREYIVAEPEPVIIIDSYLLNEQTAEWYPGTVLGAANPGVLVGRFIGPAGTKLSWSLNGGEVKTLAAGAYNDEGERPFEIKLPKNMESGRMDISVTCLDGEGNVISADTAYYNYLKPEVEEGEQLPDFVIPDSGGLHLILPGKKTASFTMLDSGQSIYGWVPGEEIAGVELSEGTGFLSVNTSGSAFRLFCKNEGMVRDAVIKIRLKNGKELSSDPINIASDITPPVVDIKNLRSGMTVGDEISLTAEAYDNIELSGLSYSVDGGSIFSLIEPGSVKILKLSNENETMIDLVVKGEDLFGNTALSYIPLLRDTSAPQLDFITTDFARNAEQISLSGRVSDGDSVDKVVISFLPPEEEPVVKTADEDAAEEDPATAADTEISAPEPADFEAVLNGGTFFLDVNLTSLGFAPGEYLVKAWDEAGNLKQVEKRLDIDINEGRPLVEITAPLENDAFESGFNLSGLILDNEGIKSIQYSLNDGPYISAGSGSLFTVPIGLEAMLDDKNTITVKAVDINGLESDPVTRSFLISREPPELTVDYPGLDSVTKGTIRISGKSSDMNGIKSVWVSHDNGISFQQAEGQEEWSYLFDTKLFDNGVSSLLIKAEDNAGTIGYYTTLINVDNEPPSVSLSRPADGEEVRSVLQLSGRAVDSSGLSSLKVYISPLENNPEQPVSEIVREISSTGIILEEIPLNDLPPGAYSIMTEAVDTAENTSTVSRVFRLLPNEIRPPVLLSPLPGEKLGPKFSIQGYLPDHSEKVLLLVNGNIYQAVDVNADGYFSCDVSPATGFPEGEQLLSLRVQSGDELIDSEGIRVEYSREGVWTVFDNLVQEQYVSDRFVIEGSTGYEADIEDEKLLAKLQPARVRFSLDGGKSFEQLRVKDGRWSYTLYREEIQDGELHLLVEAESDGTKSFARSRIVMDTRPPIFNLFEPEENQKLFENLEISGSAEDDEALQNVELSLREGDKNAYETPSFIQGMYFDASGLGATYFTAGMGLTFMDGNVKLQLQYGYAPKTVIDEITGLERAARFGGNVFGGKLLANIAEIPFSWLFGPELSAFSATVALGADFSYFSSNSVDDEDSWGVILAGLTGQVELPKISFRDRSFLKYVSLYWEEELWLISSDVSPEVVLLPSIGLRLGLF